MKTHSLETLRIGLLFSAFALTLIAFQSATAGSWVTNNSMNTARKWLPTFREYATQRESGDQAASMSRVGSKYVSLSIFVAFALETSSVQSVR